MKLLKECGGGGIFDIVFASEQFFRTLIYGRALHTIVMDDERVQGSVKVDLCDTVFLPRLSRVCYYVFASEQIFRTVTRSRTSNDCRGR